ncbi:uncharacterized protein [Rutidosis leptorrhynchoides]|uniref:uncharacterized protein n=1 Tax=Rutidosis leptorrhynchoides TaxID=125765 RepID=UPI003A9A49A0
MELMNTLRTDNSKFPFTSSQWQELEHQALVYKYMISGMPIPPDLLFSIKTSCLDSSTKLILHHHSPHQSIVGWNCFQMGFGKKIDPEPGRCRRTDGKKWRCSKEAYPDSKYCEKHMHRGRNRSRKPVELTTPPPPPPLTIMSTKSLNYPSPTSHSSPFVSHHHHQLSSSSSTTRCHADVLSSQDGFLLESSPYSHSEKDYSYRIKQDIDKHPFLSESRIGDSWHLEPLAMNNSSSSLAQSKQQTNFSDYRNDYSYLQQLQNAPRQRQKQDEGRRYDQLGLMIDTKDEVPHEKVMHHFFDESPHNDNDNYNDDHNHNKDNDSSKTQLSIAIPSYAHDFFVTHNRAHNDPSYEFRSKIQVSTILF